MAIAASFRYFGLRALLASGTSVILRRGNATFSNVPEWKRICMTEAREALPKPKRDPVSVTLVTGDGQRVNVRGKEGDTLLDMVQNSGLDLQGYGNCGGTMACSTCLVILTEEYYDKSLNEDMASEHDMIDLSGNLSLTSRLGCQLQVTKELDGMVVTIPSGVKDLRD